MKDILRSLFWQEYLRCWKEREAESIPSKLPKECVREISLQPTPPCRRAAIAFLVTCSESFSRKIARRQAFRWISYSLWGRRRPMLPQSRWPCLHFVTQRKRTRYV